MKNKRSLNIQNIKDSLSSISIIRKNTDLVQRKMLENIYMKGIFLINQDISTEFSFSSTPGDSQEKAENSFHQKYTLGKKIGEGGNGYVYTCMHKKSQKQYAVKVFKMDEQHIRELKKNFIFMKELEFPGVIQYKALYFDHEKRTTYLVMEYLPLPNLIEAKISHQEDFKKITEMLLESVEYVHNQNICHRDIKPENILYDKETKQIKLIDFGISKKTFLRGARRDMLTIIGTHCYMAPQVFLGGGYDERIDLWALGITLYKLIAKVTPFQSEYHSDTVNNIINGELKFQGQIWTQYSLSVQDFISKLLKPKEERMSVTDAKKHHWFMHSRTILPLKKQLNSSMKLSGRIKKTQTYNVEINDIFQRQNMKKSLKATSKEEGHIRNNENSQDNRSQHSLGLMKVINLMEDEEFDLNDENDYITSPLLSPSAENMNFNSFHQYSSQKDFAWFQRKK